MARDFASLLVGYQRSYTPRFTSSPRPGSSMLPGIQRSVTRCTYGVSALAKVQGETWQNGTAVYYALWPEQFRFPGVTELLFRNAAVLALVSHVTVFFQVSFPFLFTLNRRTRHVAVAMAVTFHLGIAAVMGLFTFAGFMIAADVALINDETYLTVARWARGLWKHLTARAAQVQVAGAVETSR
ncbi:MAG: HTTM domain-containing protein [Deltaproteobacteria bacterium]